MVFDLDKRDPEVLSAIDDSGNSISNGELCGFSNEFYTAIGKRTLIFILSENTIGSLAGYIGSLSGNIVPLVLSCNTDKDLLNRLIEIYKPEYFWTPERMVNDFNYPVVFSKYQYCLIKTNFNTYQLHPDLSLLLPTSGSTGSPKLVRHSYSNIENNAKNVAAFFEVTPNDRPIAILPMHYTMGLSVISSHMYAGATVLLMKSNLTEKTFWDFIKTYKATSFTGVPFSFEVLSKLRMTRMELPDLKILTQGGGKLKTEVFREFAEYAQRTGKKFIATYGQTEGTARMAYLPAELALSKIGSIGNAIPNGRLSLINEKGEEISEMEATGQMVYHGPNVTLGYATSGEDLIKGDENKGVLFTGDVSKRDADGCYFIIGRMKRFLKIYGFRIGLDELEHLIKSEFNVDCVCKGDDEHLNIVITDSSLEKQVLDYVVEKTGLFHMAIKMTIINEIPKNEAGKVIF